MAAELAGAQGKRLVQLTCVLCGRHRVRARSRRTEAENRPSGQNEHSDGPDSDHPDFLDRHGGCPGICNRAPNGASEGGRFRVGRSGGESRSTRSHVIGHMIICRREYHRSHHIIWDPLFLVGAIALASGAGDRSVPPRRDHLLVTTARGRDWRRPIFKAAPHSGHFVCLPACRSSALNALPQVQMTRIIDHPPGELSARRSTQSGELDCNRM